MTNRIAIDIGNSRISYGLFVNNELIELKHHLATNGQAASKSIVDMAHSAKTDRVALCSVVPSVGQTMLEQLKKEKLHLFQVTAANQRLISDTYVSMGADRIANAAGALKIYAKNETALVLDLGTATTLTAVSPEGKFLGGMITLGLGQTFAIRRGSSRAGPWRQWRQGPETGRPGTGCSSRGA